LKEAWIREKLDGEGMIWNEKKKPKRKKIQNSKKRKKAFTVEDARQTGKNSRGEQ